MSTREISRYDIIQRLNRGEINGTQASKLMYLSTRHVRRMKSAVNKHGPSGLINGNRGKAGNRRIPNKEKEKIVRLLHKNYFDLWPTHASEKLEKHGIDRDPKTIRNIMINEELWKPKKVKKKKHREWRQRKAFFGEMQQFDGSYHDWFENGEEHCLLLSVDDANSNITHAKFGKDEGVLPVFNFWQGYLEKNGKPMSIYTDRFSTYKMTQKQAQDNHDTKTQFQRAMQELEIEPIFAHSPEAKGRVERVFGTLQNRLVKEMRLNKIKTVEKANEYLIKEFMPWYNKTYSVEAIGKGHLHKKLTEKDKKQVKSALTRQTVRTIHNDFTISFDTKWYQLLNKQPVTIQKKDRVIMEEKQDEPVKIRLRGKYLNYRIVPKGIKRVRKDIPWVIAASSVKSPIYSKVGHF